MQRLIDKVLAPHKQYALSYMDDIIIFSPGFATHLEPLFSKHFVITGSLSRQVSVASLSDKYVSWGLLLAIYAYLPNFVVFDDLHAVSVP